MSIWFVWRTSNIQQTWTSSKQGIDDVSTLQTCLRLHRARAAVPCLAPPMIHRSLGCLLTAGHDTYRAKAGRDSATLQSCAILFRFRCRSSGCKHRHVYWIASCLKYWRIAIALQLVDRATILTSLLLKRFLQTGLTANFDFDPFKKPLNGVVIKTVQQCHSTNNQLPKSELFSMAGGRLFLTLRQHKVLAPNTMLLLAAIEHIQSFVRT